MTLVLDDDENTSNRQIKILLIISMAMRSEVKDRAMVESQS